MLASLQPVLLALGTSSFDDDDDNFEDLRYPSTINRITTAPGMDTTSSNITDRLGLDDYHLDYPTIRSTRNSQNL